MIRQLGIAVSFLILAGCAEQAVEENEGTEQLPEIPPLTYTWSHPDCPFTVDFPGEPVVTVGTTDQGVVSIHAAYKAGMPGFAVVCDAYVLDAFPNVEDYTLDELAVLYAEQVTLAPDFENATLTPIHETPFKSIKGALLRYGVSTADPDDNVHLNVVVINIGQTMGGLNFSYEAPTQIQNAGEAFFETLRIKTNN